MIAPKMENCRSRDYFTVVATQAPIQTVIPAQYPGLRGLVWNRDPARGIAAAEAFAIYERNWRHVDEGALTAAERRLVTELRERFGHGAFLA